MSPHRIQIQQQKGAPHEGYDLKELLQYMHVLAWAEIIMKGSRTKSEERRLHEEKGLCREDKAILNSYNSIDGTKLS